MPASTVVGIDGSAHAWRALDWAADYADRHRLPLLLVHGSRALLDEGTIPPDALRRLTAERQDLLAEARQYVLKVRPEIDVETRLVPADPARALVEESEHADLVAVGSRGQGGFEGLLFGSVGLHVAAHARCPALVVPRPAPYPPGASTDIVIGIEGMDDERTSIEWAFREAASRGARIVALHAVGGEFSPRRRVIEDLELSESLAGYQERYPEVAVDQLVSDRTAARALVEASESAGLVVVGARRRRSPLPGMALGRVNHTVLHHTRCPVVIVPGSG
ncbi:Nucleotide-binding universal stress protein, UspA family [Actinomadura meyerae]|uniref:Nucleotide-binding universal stress protein, UspA family n=1 Tax=Actinomadura meyerae TaxID=240840 RepID=A0A239HH72_9ACTN|nr:universal stress protein [Actinomadura meyerae]SNS80495.1 Nucleotide-binding universal stress protein, UspA family [Actinomadura meyerae]